MKQLIIMIAIAAVIFTAPVYAAKTTYDREVAIDTLIASAPAQQARIEALELRVASLEAKVNELNGIVLTFQKQMLELQKVVIAVFTKLLGG